MRHRHRLHLLASALSVLALAAPAAQAWIGPNRAFVPNRGQLPAPVAYVAHDGDAATLYVTPSALVLDLTDRARALKIDLDGASPDARMEPGGARAERFSAFLGNDPARWARNLPAYDALLLRDLWPGVDLSLRLEPGQLRYEIRARSGADRGRARFSFEGADRVERSADGAVRLEIPSGAVLDSAVAPDGAERILRWSQEEPSAGGADPVTDNPSALVWSTLIGGGDNDYSHALKLDVLGCPVVSGYTKSNDFPTTPGAYDPTANGGYDVFVAKFSPNGSTLVWSTLIGGGLEDRPFGIAFDRQERIVVGGMSYSQDFPTTPGAFDRTLSGVRDCFVLKLSADGSNLVWSTFLGGNSYDRIWELVLDADDQPVIAGETYSADFPTTPGAFQPAIATPPDGFITKMNANGTGLIWSTFLGGHVDDEATRIALGPQQQVVVTGNTGSADYPTTPGAFQTVFGGGLEDAFVTELSPGGQMIFSTFLGGIQDDWGNALAVDRNGEPIVVGIAASPDFPVTPGAYDTTWSGGNDIFVTRMDATGSHLVWSTLVGAGFEDDAYAMSLDNTGCVLVAGETNSPNFPTTPDAYDRSYAGNYDGILFRLNPSGSVLLWSTLFGGSQSDEGWEMTLDAASNPLVTGPTRSDDFPTTNGAYCRQFHGAKDVFVLNFQLPRFSAAGDPPALALAPISAGPNPFSGALDLRLDLLRPSPVSLIALDASGRAVAAVRRGFLGAGSHAIRWDGRDDRGRPVAPGVYWLRLEAGSATAQRKVVCVR